jgi:hypothetical protein
VAGPAATVRQDGGMTAYSAPLDPRAVVEYRVPAASLQAGDLVNTTPGDDDWQQVLSVHTSSADTSEPHMRALVESLGGRYVVVRLTDLAPVDGGIYFDGEGGAMVTGEDESEDLPVPDVVSGDDGERVYLFTRFELVTIRAA